MTPSSLGTHMLAKILTVPFHCREDSPAPCSHHLCRSISLKLLYSSRTRELDLLLKDGSFSVPLYLFTLMLLPESLLSSFRAQPCCCRLQEALPRWALDSSELSENILALLPVTMSGFLSVTSVASTSPP